MYEEPQGGAALWPKGGPLVRKPDPSSCSPHPPPGPLDQRRKMNKEKPVPLETDCFLRPCCASGLSPSGTPSRTVPHTLRVQPQACPARISGGWFAICFHRQVPRWVSIPGGLASGGNFRMGELKEWQPSIFKEGFEGGGLSGLTHCLQGGRVLTWAQASTARGGCLSLSGL